MPGERILSQHEVGAVVLTCIDFRFREQLPAALKETFSIESYDEIKLAGGAKNLSRPGKEGKRQVVLEDIALAINAHHVKTVVLLNHQNCGKYAAEGHIFSDPDEERVFHQSELKQASEIVRNRFPGIRVLAGYLVIDRRAPDQFQIEPIV